MAFIFCRTGIERPLRSTPEFMPRKIPPAFVAFPKKSLLQTFTSFFGGKRLLYFSEFLYCRLSDIIFVIIGQSFPCFPMFSMLMKSFTPKSMRKLHNEDHLKLVKSQILFRMCILLLHSLKRHAIFSMHPMKSFPFL